MSGPSTRARCCPACGALNGSDFDRCVRCGVALSGVATAAAGLGRYLDGSSLVGTKILAGLTLLVFAGQVMATMARGLGFPVVNGGHPADALHFGALFVDWGIVSGEPFRLLSAVFVHFGALHLGMNMLALSNLSRAVEPAVGTARYVIAYVTAGIVSFATTSLYTLVLHAEPSLTAGASGAIFGVMGVILGVLWRRRDPRWKSFAVQAVLFSVVLGFAISGHGGILVNNSAHVGGLLCGILFGVAFASSRPRKSDLAANVGAALALALCVVSLVLAHASSLWRQADGAASRSLAPEAPRTSLVTMGPHAAPNPRSLRER